MNSKILKMTDAMCKFKSCLSDKYTWSFLCKVHTNDIPSNWVNNNTIGTVGCLTKKIILSYVRRLCRL